MSDMRIVALRKKLDDSGDLGVVSEEHKSKSGHSGTSNVVVHIRNSDMKKFSNRLVAAGTSVSQSNGKHRSVSQDSILDFS